MLSNYDRQILPFATSEIIESNSSAVTVNIVSLIITHFKLVSARNQFKVKYITVQCILTKFLDITIG